MRSIVEFIQECQHNTSLVREFIEIESNDMVNEAFESSLLRKLAADIKKYEATNTKNRKERREKGGWVLDKDITFASIFGPKERKAYGRTMEKGIEGLKWNEIKDSDFRELPVEGNEKELKKLLQEIYTKNKQANIIVTKGETIYYFIKGFRAGNAEPVMYFFMPDTPTNYGTVKAGGVRKAEKPKYSSTRLVRWNEAFDILNNPGFILHILNITDSMIKQYKDLFADRKEAKKGIINFDDESLRQLLKEQRARYQELVKEMKTKKLEANKDGVLKEIQDTQAEIMELYNAALESPEDIGRRYQFGTLLQYVNYCYENFYKYVTNKKSAQKNRETGDKNDEFVAKHDERQAGENIREVEEYLNKIRKGIEQYKAGEDVWI